MKRRSKAFFSAFIGALLSSSTVFAQQKPAPPAADAAEVAKKLSNPVASLISVPFQNNTDIGIGKHNGSKNTLNIQPVIPIKLSSRLNLIGRVILPVISQNDITGEATRQTGLSDALVSAFFSPVATKRGARTHANMFGIDESADVGVDLNTPVNPVYKGHSTFSGKIDKATIETRK